MSQDNIALPGHDANTHGHRQEPDERAILTIRSHSGLSGDMLLSGLAVISMEKMSIDPQSPAGREWLASVLDRIMPDMGYKARLELESVNGIRGWRLFLDLPHEHEHRNIDSIGEIIAKSSISAKAKQGALECFDLLAQCESAAHGIAAREVHFHEVGALDSILDICGVCELLDLLEPLRIVCGPLPVCDGEIHCAHGILPAPAPATLRLLRGIPLKPFAGATDAGELLTPTAMALLHVLNVEFGPWPAFQMDYEALVYGQRTFDNAPNGVIFALGKSFGDTC